MPKWMRVCFHLVANTLACIALVAVSQVQAVPTYEIIPMGFTDAEHTRDDGSQRSEVNQINESGDVIGVSYLGNPYYGTSAWIYDGTNTVRLGFTGTEHTRPHDKEKLSSPTQLNEVGEVIGYSRRFLSTNANGGSSAWLYDGTGTIPLGLTSNRYTRSDGYKNSVAEYLNDAGQVLGYSNGYNGTTLIGSTAWLYNGTTTIEIGFTGPMYTRGNGMRVSGGLRLNEAGHIAGYNRRYQNGITDLGSTAWRYNGNTTIDIGLTGAEHSRDDGYKSSMPYEMNDAGQICGISNRYSGANPRGESAWFYDGNTTTDIGLTDTEHTSSVGYKSATPIEMNQAGHVRGVSARYNGGSPQLGYSVWLYNGVSTITLGLTGPEHTRNDGYKRSESDEMNEAGQARGSSWRFNLGSEQLGQSAWLYDGAATIELGFTGPEHTSITGTKESTAIDLNEAGHVIGYSLRYKNDPNAEYPNDDWGTSAWLFNGVSTINIGLLDSEHTGIDNYRYSEALEMNEAGHVIGRAARFAEDSSDDIGESAWLYDGVTTSNIGLTGPEFTNSEGFKQNEATQLNEAGQVIGMSRRYNNGPSNRSGEVAWFYDPTLGQSIPLELPLQDGYSFSFAEYLGEDGTVLGYSSLYAADGDYIGDRAFSFTLADGMQDLGSLVEGGLPASGWEYLANADRINGRGQIVGQGKITGQPNDIMSYLLTPVFTPGDFDEDGDVDGRDLLVWQRNPSLGDLADWQANYGVGSLASSVAVPEPSVLAIVIGTLALAGITRRTW